MRVALVKLAAKVMKLANAISGSIPGNPCGMPNSKAMPSGVMLEVTLAKEPGAKVVVPITST